MGPLKKKCLCYLSYLLTKHLEHTERFPMYLMRPTNNVRKNDDQYSENVEVMHVVFFRVLIRLLTDTASGFTSEHYVYYTTFDWDNRI